MLHRTLKGNISESGGWTLCTSEKSGKALSQQQHDGIEGNILWLFSPHTFNFNVREEIYEIIIFCFTHREKKLQLSFFVTARSRNFHFIVSGKMEFWHLEFNAMKVSSHESRIHLMLHIVLLLLTFYSENVGENV